jgi:hypothetical protein
MIGVRFPTGAEDFSSSLCFQTCSGAHPASYPMGIGGSFLEGKARSGRDADHSPPSSAEVKYEKELYLLSLHVPSWCVTGQLFLYFLLCISHLFHARYIYPAQPIFLDLIILTEGLLYDGYKLCTSSSYLLLLPLS